MSETPVHELTRQALDAGEPRRAEAVVELERRAQAGDSEAARLLSMLTRLWERAGVAEELLGDARSLRDRLHASGLSEWTLGLDDLIDELERRANVTDGGD